MDSHEDIYDAWRLLYQHAWSKYQSPQYPQQSEANLAVLMAQAEKFRPSMTAFNRALHEVKADLMRLDGKTDAADVREANQRAARREAGEEANLVITNEDYLYCASLSRAQVSEAYFGTGPQNKEFRAVYNKLIKTHGFAPPAPLTGSR